MPVIPVNAYVTPLINSNAPPGIGIFVGAQTTRAGIIGEIDNTCAIGSLYYSTAGKEYLKVANTATPAVTDWQRVTTTAAD